MNFKVICVLLLASMVLSTKKSLSKEKSNNKYFNGCATSDCIIYDLSTENSCNQITVGPTFNLKWTLGLNENVDYALLGGKIVAYQIQWSNLAWSPWYVPGYNDIDIKFNPTPKTLRKFWSYFYDHTHRYILCV